MQDRTLQTMWDAIDGLDFSRMKAKLLHQQHRNWTIESLEQAERGYRQFLKLAAKYPDTPAVPSELVDAFWHAHILDTRRYADDCVRIFGHILHHDPYVGIDGPEDEARLMAMAAASNTLNVREFGSPLTSAAYCARAATDNATYCARLVKETNAAYCARMAERTDAAYCARMATTEAAYCARLAEASQAGSQGHALAARPAYCALTSPGTVAC